MSQYSHEAYPEDLLISALASECYQQRTSNVDGMGPWIPSSSVMNKNGNATIFGDMCADNMQSVYEHRRDSSGKSSWAFDSGSVFQSTPLSHGASRKSTRWPDSFSVCSSSSFSKSISGESSECRKFKGYYGTGTENKANCSQDELDQNFTWTPRSTRRLNADKSKICQQEHVIFELIKAQCINNPLLMKKVVEWGVEHSKCSRITRAKVAKLSHGRLWITVRSISSIEDKDACSFSETMEEIKGAYQEAEPGVYKQPKGRRSETIIQHRLLKDSLGCWVIEKYDWERGEWCSAALERPNGQWIDCRNNRAIQVKVIPLQRILRKLRKNGPAFERLEKSVDFLYNSCDQMKLNGKLKTRNLKHNIANLKAKLEKQHALSFAIAVADTAESITDDAEISHPFGKCY